MDKLLADSLRTTIHWAGKLDVEDRSLPKSSHLPSSTGKTVSRGATRGGQLAVLRSHVLPRKPRRRAAISPRVCFSFVMARCWCVEPGHMPPSDTPVGACVVIIPPRLPAVCPCAHRSPAFCEHPHALRVPVLPPPALPPRVTLELSVMVELFCNCSLQ